MNGFITFMFPIIFRSFDKVKVFVQFFPLFYFNSVVNCIDKIH